MGQRTHFIISYRALLLTGLYSLFWPCWSCAQQFKDKSLSAGVMIAAGKLKDEGMSSLVYKGAYPGIQIKYNAYGYRFKQAFIIGIAGGRLSNEDNGTSLSIKTFRVNYSGMVPVIQNRRLDFSAGGGFDNYLSVRRHNQYINNKDFFEFNSSIGVAANMSYTFGDINDYSCGKFYLSCGLFSPLLTALSRSGDIHNQVSDFQLPTLKTYIKNMKYVGPGKYTRYQWFTELKRSIGKNATSLSFQWDYYHIHQDYQVRSVISQIALNYYLTL